MMVLPSLEDVESFALPEQSTKTPRGCCPSMNSMPTVTEVPESQVDAVVQLTEPALVVRTRELLPVRPQFPQRVLFSDSLLDAGNQDKSRRRSATILSFAFQCLLLGVVLIVPL